MTSFAALLIMLLIESSKNLITTKRHDYALLWRYSRSASRTPDYLIGSKNEISNIKMVKKIINIFKSISKIRMSSKGYKFVIDRKGHDFRYAIDNKKLLKLIEIKFLNFDQKLKNTIKFYINNYISYKRKLNEKWLKKKIENY